MYMMDFWRFSLDRRPAKQLQSTSLSLTISVEGRLVRPNSRSVFSIGLTTEVVTVAHVNFNKHRRLVVNNQRMPHSRFRLNLEKGFATWMFLAGIRFETIGPCSMPFTTDEKLSSCRTMSDAS